jgi:hypothetical protein
MTTLTIDNQQVFEKVTTIGLIVMICSISIFTSTLLISFPFAEHFSIMQQALAHIMTIVFAGVFKVGYVVFAIGRHERKLSF